MRALAMAYSSLTGVVRCTKTLDGFAGSLGDRGLRHAIALPPILLEECLTPRRNVSTEHGWFETRATLLLRGSEDVISAWLL